MLDLRRLAPAMALLLLAACSGDAPTAPDPGPVPEPAAVEISPAEEAVTALGETVAFSATVRDQTGAAMPGISIEWESLDPEVATVDAQGTATAVGAGAVGIVARAAAPTGASASMSAGAADTATLVVTQEAAAIAVEPETVELELVGDTARLSATARDANEHDIPAEPAAFAWSSSDEDVVTVADDGLLTAVAPGSATVTASLDGQSAGASVEVAAPEVEITAPEDGSIFQDGEEIHFQGSASDAAGTPLTGGALVWSSDRDGEIGTGESFTRNDLSVGTHAITLRATDEHGASGTAGVEIQIPFNMSVVGMYVNQATQSPETDIPLVADRPGLLRVFARANAENDHRPTLRVEVHWNGALEEVFEATLPFQGVPLQAPAEMVEPGGSWDVELPGRVFQPGFGLRVEVDPEGTIPVGDPEDNRFPATGGPLELEVLDLGRFEARLVPVHHTEFSLTGRADDANRESYLDLFVRSFPIGEHDVDVREVYSSSAVDGFGRLDTSGLLAEIRQVRIDDQSDRYYYGVFRMPGPEAGADATGRGYLGIPAAVGWDSDHQSGFELVRGGTYAHEIGHNFNRWHSPCPAGVSFLDVNYPYPDGSIGQWGWDRATGEERHPALRDIMGGCRPRWVSDYTYRGALEFRRARAGAEPSARRAASPDGPAVVFWGSVSPEGVTIEPAFESPVGASVQEALEPEVDRAGTPGPPGAPEPGGPPGAGPYLLEGLDEGGAVLFARAFRGWPVAHGEPGERHFSVRVPVAEAAADRLAEVRVRAEGHVTSLRPHAPDPRVRPDATEPDLRLQVLERAAEAVRPLRVGPDRVRVRWDSTRFPLAVVRNPRTGRILSLARGGEATVLTRAAELEVELSDGVRSVGRTLRVER